MPVSPKPAHRLIPIMPVAARGDTPPPDAPNTDKAEKIGYAQQDHEQRIIEPVDDFLIGNAAEAP